jgi:hypothetical protein
MPARSGCSEYIYFTFECPKRTALASIFNAMRTIYCVSDARQLQYSFSQVL